MRKKLLSLLALALCIGGSAIAQTRYLDDVFTRTTIQKQVNLSYGENYYFLAFPPAPAGTSTTTPKDTVLQMDLYTPPASDTDDARPLVVYLHTGVFLPKYFNGSPTGSKSDSTVVEMCYRFAQKGYVVAAPAYRLGWNPLGGTLEIRTSTLLNAVYRAIHDVQTCVRFFKRYASTYGIDPDRIYVIGQGSAGYIALAYPFLDKQEETELPKFVFNGSSVVDTALVGNVDGTGGLYNIYNHPGYSNSVCMVANIGGAMGDISWMDQTWPRVPVAGLHCRRDVFAPYDSGTVIVPTTGQPVVDVHGTRTVIRRAVQMGLNDIWVNNTFTDPYSLRAYQLNPQNTYEGLFQIERPEIPGPAEEGSPWEWWDSTVVTMEAQAYGYPLWSTIHTDGLETNPDMSKGKAMAYIDTIVGFLTPRMYLVYQDQTVGVNNPQPEIQLNVYPNPSADVVTIQTGGSNMIEVIELMDMSGRSVLRVSNIFASTYTFSKSAIKPGNYVVAIKTTEGNIRKHIVLQ